MLQNFIVAVIVIAAALFATWRLAGAGARLRWLEAVAARLDGSGRVAALLQRQVAKRRAAATASGCGACAANPSTKELHGQPPRRPR